ncbi:MAG TPA: hypothetical protein VJ888_04910 [Mobilitalea sp.]|nr:hypothetical protein [Mobilitalea sp.]
MNKMERRFGKYAIPNLMKYVIVLYAIGLIIGMTNTSIISMLGLEFNMIMKGQIWRLVTFLIPINFMRNIIYVLLKAYIFYMIGNTLERAWGTFRLNFYFFSGVLLNILAALITYIITSYNILGYDSIPSLSAMLTNNPLDLIYSSLFFAFAALFPNTQFLLYFIIPVKVKYLSWISGAFYIYMIYQCVDAGYYYGIIPIVVSLVNFVIFFFATRKNQRFSPRELDRKAKFRKQMNEGRNTGNVVDMQGKSIVTRHKCAVCGRTELDNDQLEFRFCSKCDGNYEYCMDHLFTHEHVNKED